MIAPLRIIATAILLACAGALPVEAQAPGIAQGIAQGVAQGVSPPGVPVPRPRPTQGTAPRGETDALKSDVTRNEAFQQRLGAELEAARGDRGKLNQLLVETAARSREVEQNLIEVEARMTELDRTGAQIQASLLQRREVLAEVLAALVRMGRNPPPALLMRPGDALDAVRSAILLGAILPEMRVEAETLAADLAELAQVRSELGAARERLTSLRRALEEDRARIAALVGERQRRQAEANPVLPTEKSQADSVAKGTGDVHDLVTRLETEVPPAARAAEAARTGPAAATGDGTPNATEIAALQNPARIAPAMPFAEAKGLLPLPVAGVRLKDFGATDGVGGTEKGLTIATRMGAQVTAPTDGWVVYAGPFRSYGQLLIINAGGGYHVLMAGMERITVDLGQFVLAGEPVAVMGSGSRAASAASGQPQLYVEFRKDGISIDPAPWWAATDSQKVRG